MENLELKAFFPKMSVGVVFVWWSRFQYVDSCWPTYFSIKHFLKKLKYNFYNKTWRLEIYPSYILTDNL